MLYDIRYIDLGPVNSSFEKRLVQQFSSRPDERASNQILTITRLFPDKHDSGLAWTLPKHRLRCVFP